LNEAERIKDLICHLRDNAHAVPIEIIVVDGGSKDNTKDIAKSQGAMVYSCSIASRPAQMNLGASHAHADVLYFIHADALPPDNYTIAIINALKKAQFGCFRFRFESNRWTLKINAFFTRLPLMICRGGDQSLFITRALFDRVGGFDESHVVMEDYDIIRRGRRLGKFMVIPEDVVVSARKYDENSYTRVNLSNLVVFLLYYAQVNPKKLKTIYTRMLNHPKF
jgi:rSAM/selenodomain-associated transferase 2